MSPAAAAAAAASAEPDEDQRDRRVSRFIFFFFVLGAILLCVGILLSIFGYQACQYEKLPDCSVVLKVAGPACAVVGLGAVILARSRARLQLQERRRRGLQLDPDRAFLCGESRQFAQCLIFGFLFLASGMLISVLGIWVPGCGSVWAQESLNETDSADAEPQICGLLSLQIMGPLVVLVGLCFFVVAHIKKKNNLNVDHESAESEERQAQGTEPVQVTVGDAVIIFPPPPPPYFPESSASTRAPSPGANSLLPSENPPSYYSIFNYGTPAPGAQGAFSERARDSIYTISGTTLFPETSSQRPSELPPRYEEKEVTAASPPASRPSPP